MAIRDEVWRFPLSHPAGAVTDDRSRFLKQRIDERRQCGRFSENDKKRKQYQEYENRSEPPSLGSFQKIEQLGEYTQSSEHGGVPN
jgi:hypothetical protein